MRIQSICVAIVGAVMLSDSAFALSCMRPDLVKTLEDAKASEKLYHILVGKFVSVKPRANDKSHNGYILPQHQLKPKPPVISQTYFEGFSLAQDARMDGHLTSFPVDIETSCAGQWCSSPPPPDREIIAFVEAREGQPPLLKISPCPYWTFSAEQENVQKLRQCLDKSCESDLPNW